MEFNVWCHNFNAQEITTYNVLNNYLIKEVISPILNEHENNKREFAEAIRSEMMYRFCAKAEWEIIISPWVGLAKERKIDVYKQIMINFDLFINYLWNNQEEIKKIAKEKEQQL